MDRRLAHVREVTPGARKAAERADGTVTRTCAPRAGAALSGGRGTVRRTRWILALLALTILLAACSKTAPQNTMNPKGPTAQTEKNLLVLVLWPAAATRLEIGWTIAPAIVLAVIMVPTVSTIWQLARQPADAMQITVEGYQWWWGFRYTDPDMTVSYGNHDAIVTADVMVIPAGRTINLSLTSLGGGARSTSGVPDHEVIHSFWAPELFGKQDVIPGETNHIVFSADAPGVYWGQCAEFCGLQHGKMKFRIRALDETDWQRWVANEKNPAVKPTVGAAQQGMDLFFGTNGVGGQCIQCHGVGGTAASSTAAPNLTHFAATTHECFAGCDFEVFNPDGTPNVEALKAWLRDPNAVKLGAKMPDYGLTEQQIDILVAYLYSLK